MTHIIADVHIPYVNVLQTVADLELLEPSEITAGRVSKADALLIRTRTRCNASLLEGSHVHYIATATIGYDHIDTDFCRLHGIGWSNAPGCNAPAVCEYVEAALNHYAAVRHIALQQLVIGIIGVGHVGSLVHQMCRRHGMQTLLCDPPRRMSESGCSDFCDMQQILQQADIITVHTPLTTAPPYPTHLLLDEQAIRTAHARLIINAARGGIVDEQAVVRSGKDYIVDCWQNEPDICHATLQHALIATPHIAGYSMQGKANASTCCIRALSRFFHLGLDTWTAPPAPAPLRPYDIMHDDRMLRQSPDSFEALRSSYPLR
ncbi:MAG: 4-phosphoerythronate dehydrogenase [Paludibacteraceae bacterium]|nr:4-phosphoerythronate dehydrogenase [Paludibacteraceae bacterium]